MFLTKKIIEDIAPRAIVTTRFGQSGHQELPRRCVEKEQIIFGYVNI